MNSQKHLLCKNILVTGGAGFIGSFLVDKLIKKGCAVRILDNLEEQVHQGKVPSYLNKNAEFIKGDVRDYRTIERAISGIDAVFHLAAAVGVAQSNYEIKKYSDVNVGGMANLLDALVKNGNKVRKIITNSSMTGLGEGNYQCSKCAIVRPPIRNENQLKTALWEPKCPDCGNSIKPIPTEETAIEYPNCIYAITKKTQQDMLMLYGSTYDIPTVALRCFNVYGPRQSLSNPYTGVTAIFISRMKNNQQAIIYEDGLQSRDFVSVHDVVDALILSLETNNIKNEILNIGSGKPTSIKEIAETIQKLLATSNMVKISGEFRRGDIRHCFADINKAKSVLGWKPTISLEEGFEELIKWSTGEQADDRFTLAEQELREKGIL